MAILSSVEGQALRDVADTGAGLPGDRSLVRHGAEERAQQHGLAGAIRAEDREDIAPADGTAVLAVLNHTAGRATLLAGDFNAWPTHASLDLVRVTNRFKRVIDAQPTHPADRPRRTIDYVIAPSTWELLEYWVLDTQVSDHRPVFARFRCPRAECASPDRSDDD